VPPEDGEETRARGDGPVGSTFDVVIPNLAAQLADALQAIEGTEGDATDLTAGGRRLLTTAAKQIHQTKLTVDRYWPPVPTED
jgi:ABC-type transporter Mla subunit MlaD